MNKLCTRIPNYPQKAFIAFSLILNEDKPFMFYAYEPIYTTLTQFQADSQNLRKDINLNKLKLSDHAIFIPINFKELFELKPTYWDNPTNHYDISERFPLMFSLLKNSLLYQILVTPSGIHQETEFFKAAIPLFVNAKPNDIEKFMFLSDYPVEVTAKYAALYTSNSPIGINWITGTILPPEAIIQIPNSNSN
jgi:hypothetical protein